MSGAPSASDRRRLPLTTAAALTIVATIVLYWPALGAGFVGDDFMILHRVRGLEHAHDVLRFFRGEFFEYYRPLGFVSHALDWTIAGQNAREFHLTNILLHLVNTTLVLLIGRSLSTRPLAGLLAAALFALHASSNEAVVWISARFDLLATCFTLAALYCIIFVTGRATVPPAREAARTAVVVPEADQPQPATRKGSTTRLNTTPANVAATVLFFLALLSKEAAVALPIAAAGWSTFRLRATTSAAVAFVVPWLVALASYSALRNVAGGISAVGGSSRLPKLAAFTICLVVVVALSSERWIRVRDWLRPRRTRCALIAIAAIAGLLLAAAAAPGRPGALAREKLSVAGFATFYLISPVLSPGESVFSDPTAPAAWILGAIALAGLVAVAFLLWRRLVDDDRCWFLGTLLVATLLPISALTEGKRYLYLPSAAVSLMVALIVVESHGRRRRIALAVVASVLAISTLQVAVRVQDWKWAGRMTAEGAQLVDSVLAPSCGTGQVVFLTSPVATRGVYSHFYYETFEVPRGCMPESFQVVVRVVRIDSPVEVTWDGPDQIVITAPDYHGNFLLSSDLREFDTPLLAGRSFNLATPLGAVSATASGGTAQVKVTLSADARRRPIHFFYYAGGRIQALAASP